MDRLQSFVEQCVQDEVELIAVFGPDCECIHDTIDEILLEIDTEVSNNLPTSWHDDEPYEDAVFFARNYKNGRGGFIEVRI